MKNRCDRVGFYFYSGKKQMRELFFRNSELYFFKSCACMIISSDIIQVRPLNLTGKASAHQVDLISSQIFKTYTLGA